MQLLLHRRVVALQEPRCIHVRSSMPPSSPRRHDCHCGSPRQSATAAVASSKRSTVRQPVASSISTMSIAVDVDGPARVERLEHGPGRRGVAGGVGAAVDQRHVGPERDPAQRASSTSASRACTASTPPAGSSTCRYTPHADFPQWAPGRAARERCRGGGRRGDELGGPGVIGDVVDERDVAADAAAHHRVPPPPDLVELLAHRRRHEQHDGPPQHVAHRRAGQSIQ